MELSKEFKTWQHARGIIERFRLDDARTVELDENGNTVTVIGRFAASRLIDALRDAGLEIVTKG